MTKGTKIRYIASVAFALVAAVLLILGRCSVEFATWYATYIYPVITLPFTAFWGVLPISAGEIVLLMFILAVLAWIFLLIFCIVRDKAHIKATLLRFMSYLTAVATLIFLILTLNCSINYNRTPFSAYSGLTVTEYTRDELRYTAEKLIEGANKYSQLIETDENGVCVKPENISELAINAMNKMGDEYRVLDVYYPQPKPVIMSEIMSSCNLCGIYFPFTVEANYNNNMPASNAGFTVCHELSHLSGFMREDEANFIAFLACSESDNAYMSYCGYIGALVYALNAYASDATDEEYSSLFYSMNEQVINELRYRYDYWKPYQKTVVAQVSMAVNDAYLKSQNQTDGEKSYGRVVDLLIAYYECET